MNKVLVGVVGYPAFAAILLLMGLSMGGAEASLETVGLDDFLDWCGARRLRPSETALDACAQQFRPSLRHEPLSAAKLAS